jgi:hypothetical protein
LILRYEWLRLIKEQDMINKTVYVFEVIE